MFGKVADVGAYAKGLAAVSVDVEMLVCPPFTLLGHFVQALQGSAVALGGAGLSCQCAGRAYR